MRLQPAGRVAPRHAAAAALALGTTLSVTALAFGQSSPAHAPESSTVLRAPAVQDARLRFGQPIAVSGRVPAADAGRALTLQYAPRGRRWRAVAHGRVARDGRYRFRAEPRKSGKLRILMLPAGAEAAGAAAVTAEAPRRSRARGVAVAGKLVVDRGGRDVHAGDVVHVRGTLLPRGRGRRVVVEAGRHGRWHAVARARTRADGHFDARLATGAAGTQRLRVRFAGDRRNAGVRAGAGTLRAFRPGLASWYGLYGGALACGGTLGYGTLGVANKTLPCGTKVTLRYHGRQVTVPVIDRGPYAGGREWDLTGATARRLGFDGVGVVWSTV